MPVQATIATNTNISIAATTANTTTTKAQLRQPQTKKTHESNNITHVYDAGKPTTTVGQSIYSQSNKKARVHMPRRGSRQPLPRSCTPHCRVQQPWHPKLALAHKGGEKHTMCSLKALQNQCIAMNMSYLIGTGLAQDRAGTGQTHCCHHIAAYTTLLPP